MKWCRFSFGALSSRSKAASSLSSCWRHHVWGTETCFPVSCLRSRCQCHKGQVAVGIIVVRMSMESTKRTKTPWYLSFLYTLTIEDTYSIWLWTFWDSRPWLTCTFRWKPPSNSRRSHGHYKAVHLIRHGQQGTITSYLRSYWATETGLGVIGMPSVTSLLHRSTLLRSDGYRS